MNIDKEIEDQIKVSIVEELTRTLLNDYQHKVKVQPMIHKMITDRAAVEHIYIKLYDDLKYNVVKKDD